MGTGTCAHFKTDCTRASALYTTTDGGAHCTLRASGTAAASGTAHRTRPNRI